MVTRKWTGKKTSLWNFWIQISSESATVKSESKSSRLKHLSRTPLVLHMRTAVGQRSFAVNELTIGKSLPPALWAPELSQNTFTCALKTHLFLTAQNCWDVSTRFQRQLQMHWLTYYYTGDGMEWKRLTVRKQASRRLVALELISLWCLCLNQQWLKQIKLAYDPMLAKEQAGVNRITYWSQGVASLSHKCQPPLPSDRQHPSYGDCLEVKRELRCAGLYT